MDIYEVFTPTSYAKNWTFVNRQNLTNRLIKGLKTPGKQIIIYGKSGAGKSTLILNTYQHVFGDFIRTVCQRDIKFDELVIDAFDQLNSYYLKEYGSDSSVEVKGGISASFWNWINASGEIGHNAKKNKGYERVVPFQLNIRNLSTLLKESNICWIIEDFHKVGDNVKVQLADSLKVFIDDGSQIIAIGAVNSPTEVIELNPELNNRIMELSVPLMSSEELTKIIRLGAVRLNIKFDRELIRFIARFSFGYPANCHQLCLNVCEYKSINSRQRESTVIEFKAFLPSLREYVIEKSDSYKNRLLKSIDPNVMLHKLNKKIIVEYINKGDDIFNLSDFSKRLEIAKDDLLSSLTKMTANSGGTIFVNEYNTEKYIMLDPFFLFYCISYFFNEIDEINPSEKEKPIIWGMSNCEVIKMLLFNKAHNKS